MTLEERIARLERQNRWMKCAGGVAVVLVGLFLTLGQSKPPDIIEARKFVVVDEQGSAMGDFGFNTEGGWLALYGKENSLVLSGEPSIKLDEYELGNIMITGRTMVLSGEPSIVLDGKERGGNIMINVNHGGGQVHLRSKSGYARMQVFRMFGSQLALGTPDGSGHGVALDAGMMGYKLNLSSKKGNVSVGGSPEDPLHIAIWDSDNKKELFKAP